MGRQAASAKDSSAGLGSRLRFGTATFSAIVPWCSSENSERLGSSVSSPVQPGLAMTPCTTTSLPSSSSPAASVPRIIGIRSAGRPTPAEAEQVVVVERDGLDLDRRPAVGRLRLRPVTDLQHGQRVLRGGRGDEGSKHDRDANRAAVRLRGRRRIAAVALGVMGSRAVVRNDDRITRGPLPTGDGDDGPDTPADPGRRRAERRPGQCLERRGGCGLGGDARPLRGCLGALRRASHGRCPDRRGRPGARRRMRRRDLHARRRPRSRSPVTRRGSTSRLRCWPRPAGGARPRA